MATAPTLKPTAFETDGCHWFTSLGSNTGTDWPNSMLAWGSQTPGWTGDDLAQWNKMSGLIQRAPRGLRVYSLLADITNTSGAAGGGTSGSAGNYGWPAPVHCAIMNAGGAILATFMLGSGASSDIFTDVTGHHHDNDLDKFIQNIKRWADDTGNHANPKKLILGYHHEPSNDTKTAGSATQYKAAYRYIVGYFAAAGIGPGLEYDVVEWAFVDIMTAFNNAAFFPGDDIITWALGDGYNWSGGLITSAGANGHIPTLGDNVGSGHYNDAWRSIVKICQPLLNFLDDHPTLRSGLGEWAASGDIDRYTVNSSDVLVNPKTHTGDPNKLTEWVLQSLNGFKGLASDAGTTADNAFDADPRMTRLQIVSWWNSQQAGPRWLNQMPIASGGTVPGVGLPAGVTQNDVLNAIITISSDPYFNGNPSPIVDPVLNALTATSTDNADEVAWSLTATPGSSADLSYTIDFGDGSVPLAGTFPAPGDDGTTTVSGLYVEPTDGTWRITGTILDGNGRGGSTFEDVAVSGGSPAPVVDGDLELWQTGDRVEDHGRVRFNAITNAVATLRRLVAGFIDPGSADESGNPSTGIFTQLASKIGLRVRGSSTSDELPILIVEDWRKVAIFWVTKAIGIYANDVLTTAYVSETQPTAKKQHSQTIYPFWSHGAMWCSVGDGPPGNQLPWTVACHENYGGDRGLQLAGWADANGTGQSTVEVVELDQFTTKTGLRGALKVTKVADTGNAVPASVGGPLAVPSVANEEYVAALWVQAGPLAAARASDIYVQWLDSSGDVISDSSAGSLSLVSGSAVPTLAGWQCAVTPPVTAPAGTAFRQVLFSSPLGKDEFFHINGVWSGLAADWPDGCTDFYPPFVPAPTGAGLDGGARVGDIAKSRKYGERVCVVAGAPDAQRWSSPLLTATNKQAAGEATLDRRFVVSQAAQQPSGRIVLTYMDALQTEQISSVAVYTVAAAGATPTLCRIGIYEADADNNLTLVASTANDTTLFAAANTKYKKALSAPFTKTAGKRYAVGVLVVTGAAMPTFAGSTMILSGLAIDDDNWTSTAVSGQSDLPSTIARASQVGLSVQYFAALT